MWAALVRNLLVFVLTRRGKRVLAFVGTMLLCFFTALLIDLQLYLSAGFTGALAAVALAAFFIQSFRYRKELRDRLRQDIEYAVAREAKAEARAARRAAATEARAEKMQRAKASVAGAVKGVAGGAATVMHGARAGFAGVRGRLNFWRSKPRAE